MIHPARAPAAPRAGDFFAGLDQRRRAGVAERRGVRRRRDADVDEPPRVRAGARCGDRHGARSQRDRADRVGGAVSAAGGVSAEGARGESDLGAAVRDRGAGVGRPVRSRCAGAGRRRCSRHGQSTPRSTWRAPSRPRASR